MDKSFQATISEISKSTNTPDMMCRGFEKRKYMTVNLSLIIGHIEGEWTFHNADCTEGNWGGDCWGCEVTGDGDRGYDDVGLDRPEVRLKF